MMKIKEDEACEEEVKYSNNKPLALQRILLENGPVGNRPRTKIKDRESATRLLSEDKENSELGAYNSETGQSRLKDEEQDWFPEEPMSSTVMDRSTPDRYRRQGDTSSIFTTSDNLSSIAGPPNPPSGTRLLFKTPKRREEWREAPGTPATNGSTPSDSSGKTPSSGSSIRTPRSSERRGSRTPSSASSGTRWNPFDSYDRLHHQPTLSPGVFATVVSPSQDSESSSGRFWSIEQQGEIFPASISEDSPLKQSLLTRHHSKDLENQTQDQLDLYFKQHHTISSPVDLDPVFHPTGNQLVDTPISQDASYMQGERRCVSAWTQTQLTIPPNPPAELEALLQRFCTFKEPLGISRNLSMEEASNANNLSNSTLRRKLFNGDAKVDEEEEEEDRISSSSSDSPCPSPENLGPMVTPGRVIRTPSTAMSSSPVRKMCGRATSFSPPDQLGSPIFSPIGKQRLTRRTIEETQTDSEEEMDSSFTDLKSKMVREPRSPATSPCRQQASSPCHSAVCSQNDTADMTAQSTSLLYQSAIQDMDTDSGAAWSQSRSRCQSGREGYGWAASTAADGWTEHTREEGEGEGEGSGWTASDIPDITTDEQADTGYSTNRAGSRSSLATSSELLPSQDSGAVHNSGQRGGLSAIELPNGANVTENKAPLLSYAAENSNDISVGFPQLSSTPTKK